MSDTDEATPDADGAWVSLFSGGKDSSWALYQALERELPVERLVTVHPAGDSYMYHVPATRLASLAAESIGIPLVEVEPDEGFPGPCVCFAVMLATSGPLQYIDQRVEHAIDRFLPAILMQFSNGPSKLQRDDRVVMQREAASLLCESHPAGRWLGCRVVPVRRFRRWRPDL